MQPNQDDIAYLRDMLEFASKAHAFVDGVGLEEFTDDERTLFAVERTLELVGEAARRVSMTGRAAHPEIPWGDILGQRNVLAHDYGYIDVELVWAVAVNDIPVLIEQLRSLLA